MNSTKFTKLFFIFPLFLLLLGTGCGEDQQAQEVVYKRIENTVYVRLPGNPRTLNPILATDLYSRIVFEELFQYLMEFDPQTLETRPVLVKELPRVTEVETGPHAGGVRYEFELREAARWDDGTPVTAHDVAFTLKTLLHPGVNAAAIRGYFEYLKDLEIDPEQPRKFAIITEKYILNEAAISGIPVYPEHLYDPEGLLRQHAFTTWTNPEQAAQLVNDYGELAAFAERFNSPEYGREADQIHGSGPYRLVRWDSEQEVVLEKKADWWGDALAGDQPILAAHPERIVFRIIPDQTAAMTAIKDELVDVANQLDAKDFTDLQQNEYVNERYNFYNPVTFQMYYVGINNRHPKLEDKRVRRALAHVINVDEVIESLYYGLAQRVNTTFHPRKSYYHTGLAPIPYDIEKAQALLRDAGWEDTNDDGTVDKQLGGERVELELAYLTSTSSKFGKNLALLLQNNAKLAGIKIDIVEKEFQTLIGDLRQRNYELSGGAWAQEPIPDDPKQAWHTESDRPDGFNRASFGNAESDALIDEIRVTLDATKRDSLYRVFQELIYEEQPLIFLFAPQERIVIHKRFDAQPTSLRPGYVLDQFKLTDQ